MVAVVFTVAFLSTAAFAGPYTESGVPADDPRIVGWAAEVIDYSPAPDVGDSWNDSAKTLGPATGNIADVASLGECPDLACEPGRITVEFDEAIADGDGPDLAVFENSFPPIGGEGLFCELGWIEVSTDGETFARFPGTSLTPEPLTAYAPMDATDVIGFAGKHRNAYGVSEGTPFDLADLADDPAVVSGAVDLAEIRVVRIVDVPGFGGYLDAEGNAIYDPFPTTDSAGFDLEAVAVLGTPTGDDDAADDDSGDDAADDDADDFGDDDDTGTDATSADDARDGCG
jgi:hypothetical protein